MITLAINTATSTSEIALLDDEKILAQNSWPGENREAEKLMPEIAALYEQAKIPFKKTERVLAVKGPGSFTGLRVGVTVANAFSYLSRAKAYAIDTFDYFWQQYRLDNSDSLDMLSETALLIYAGSGGVFVSFNMRKSTDSQLIDLGNIVPFLQQNMIKNIFGDLSDSQKEVLEDFEFLEPGSDFGQTMASLPIDKYLVESKPFRIIHPLYLKGPGISESKKSIFGT